VPQNNNKKVVHTHGQVLCPPNLSFLIYKIASTPQTGQLQTATASFGEQMTNHQALGQRVFSSPHVFFVALEFELAGQVLYHWSHKALRLAFTSPSSCLSLPSAGIIGILTTPNQKPLLLPEFFFFFVALGVNTGPSP
jgi:hypothetical protein